MTVNSTTSGHWTTPSVWSSDSEPGALSGIFDISPLEFADGQTTTITGELLINAHAFVADASNTTSNSALTGPSALPELSSGVMRRCKRFDLRIYPRTDQRSGFCYYVDDFFDCASHFTWSDRAVSTHGRNVLEGHKRAEERQKFHGRKSDERLGVER